MAEISPIASLPPILAVKKLRQDDARKDQRQKNSQPKPSQIELISAEEPVNPHIDEIV